MARTMVSARKIYAHCNVRNAKATRNQYAAEAALERFNRILSHQEDFL